jgi:hypothetical protein
MSTKKGLNGRHHRGHHITDIGPGGEHLAVPGHVVVKALALWWQQGDDAIDGHPHNRRLTKSGISAIEGR